MPLVRVQLICDHQMLSDALTFRLRREPDGFLVRCRRSTDAALLDTVRAHRPDLVAVDARSVSGSWAAFLDDLAVAVPDARQVVLARTASPDDAVAAARRCVAAWIGPDASADEVVHVLRLVAGGHTVYPSTALGAVLRRFADERRAADPGSGPLALLTDREREVLACLVEGWPGPQVADHLDMAANTVRTHTNRIFRKLGVHSRLEAVRIARENDFRPGAAVGATRPVSGRIHLVATTAPEPRRPHQSEYQP